MHEWADDYGCLTVCLFANIPLILNHNFAPFSKVLQCNEAGFSDRWCHCIVMHDTALKCIGVDAAEEAEKDVRSYASSFGQSVIYAIMRCTMQPPLSRHNPLFLQLCMASWDFSPPANFCPASHHLKTKRIKLHHSQNPIKIPVSETHIAYRLYANTHNPNLAQSYYLLAIWISTRSKFMLNGHIEKS